MKQKEITILTDDELNDKLGAFQKNLHDMKLTHAVSPVENPLQIRNIRRTIARLKTELLKRTNKQ
jgi:large subunit ribosomal protein L29